MHSACEQNMLPKLSQCDRDYLTVRTIVEAVGALDTAVTDLRNPRR